MKNIESKTPIQNPIGELGSALFELRDALVELSLSLKDLQFEADLEKRENSEEAVRHLLLKITSI